MRRFPVLFAWFTAALASACASPTTLPPTFQGYDSTVTFVQVKDTPDSYRGKLVMFGGEVLAARRLKEGTRIEILQLPLDGSQIPVSDLTTSQGRFLAIQRDFLDPATIPPGTRVTVTGEVLAPTAGRLDEMDYTFPTLEVRSFKVWPKQDSALPRSYSYPYTGTSWGWPYQWGPYRYW